MTKASPVDVARVIAYAARCSISLRYVESEGSWFIRTRDHWNREGGAYPLYRFRACTRALRLKGRTLATDAEQAARRHSAFAVATVDDLPTARASTS